MIIVTIWFSLQAENCKEEGIKIQNCNIYNI